MGDTRNIYKSLNAVTVSIPEEKKPKPSYSLWDDNSLGNRLNSAGIVIGVFDELMDFVAEAYSSFDSYLYSLPNYAWGIYYIAPTLLPFLPTLYEVFRNTLQTNFVGLKTRERLELKEELLQNQKIRAEFEDKPALMEDLIDIVQDHFKDPSQKVGIIINLVFLALRIFQGIVALLSPVSKDEIDRVTNLISSAINIGYFFAQGIRRNHTTSNTHAKLSIDPHRLLSESKNTYSNDFSPQLKEPLLTPSI